MKLKDLLRCDGSIVKGTVRGAKENEAAFLKRITHLHLQNKNLSEMVSEI